MQRLFTLGLLVIVKNEGMVIKEFIEHYKWQGVEHIYLIDNGCTDNTCDVISPLVQSKYLSYFKLLADHAQTQHYNAVLRSNIKHECEWLIICDADEYIYATTPGRTILDEVKALPPATSCIELNWRVFGSSGLSQQPESIRTSFVMCEDKLQEQCKTIVRTDSVDALEIHKQSLNYGDTLYNPPCLSINHYAIMSWEYFSKVKMTRGDASWQKHDAIRNEQYFRSYDEAFGKTPHLQLAKLVRAAQQS